MCTGTSVLTSVCNFNPSEVVVGMASRESFSRSASMGILRWTFFGACATKQTKKLQKKLQLFFEEEINQVIEMCE